MYHIITKIPHDGKKEFWGSSLVITNLFIGLMNSYLDKVICRIYWYNVSKVEIWNINRNKLLNTFHQVDIFDMKFLCDPKNLPCDY